MIVEPPLFLAGSSGKRTDFSSLVALIGGIDGLQADAVGGDQIDVRFSGLSFTLSPAETVNLASFQAVLGGVDGETLTDVINFGLGAHIAGGERMAPVLQAYLSLAVKIGTTLGLSHLGWRPSQTLVRIDQVSHLIADYAAGGAFPVPALIRIDATKDGLVTHGASWFCGQELEFTALHLSKPQIVKRMIRIVNDLVQNGPIGKVTQIEGLDEGERIMLWPEEASAGARLIGKSVV